jgi:hypothetical protein
MRLGVVPATVEREVDGKRGVLQARPVQWLTQADAQRQAVRAGGACSMGSQFQLLYALDVLMGNEARTSASILFDSNEWYVYSTSHERAFGATKGLPAYLKARPPAPGAEIRRRAAALDEAGLQVALGNLVDARGVKAILQRRDVLMALPGAQPP